MHIVDLRSDTVTLPSPAMREAMYRAKVGDDVYGEDPTINRLEEMVAERLGKEAALFVVSGTMGNLVSLLSHCNRGDEIIMGQLAHIFLYEAGGVAALGGIHTHTLPNLPNGMLDPQSVEGALRDPKDVHHPRSRVICLENTHNRCGGAVLSPEQMATIKAIADRNGLAVHLDGARIFNAAIALGIDVQEIAAQADSIQLCFSKGLAAPVGSAICGSADFIEKARHNRKIVGGGMRQAGVIAAAAIVALEQMVDRLADDHENARRLAAGLADMDGIVIDPAAVQTNIVVFGLANPAVSLPQVSQALATKGIQINPIDPSHFRAVTHYGVEREDIDRTLIALRETLAEVA